jgi:hypothetical protein
VLTLPTVAPSDLIVIGGAKIGKGSLGKALDRFLRRSSSEAFSARRRFPIQLPCYTERPISGKTHPVQDNVLGSKALGKGRQKLDTIGRAVEPDDPL